MNTKKITYLSTILMTVVGIWLFWIVEAQEIEDDLWSFLNEILAAEEETFWEWEDTENADNTEPAEAAQAEEKAEDHDSAEDILNQVDDDKRSYAEDLSIKVQKRNPTSVELYTSKALYDGEEVEKYRAYYSEKTLWTQKLDLIKDIIITRKALAGNNKNKVSLTLKNLKPETTYYIVVSPIHPTDPSNEPLTMITDEISFTTTAVAPPKEEKPVEKKEEPTKQPAAEEKAEPKNTAQAEEKKEPAAEAKQPANQPAEQAWPKPTDVIFKSVNYTNNDSNITLTRNKNGQPAVQKAEVHLRHQWESAYTNIWAPMFNAWKFSFNVSKTGNYFLKLKWMNAQGDYVGKEHIQTVKVSNIVDPVNNPQAVVTNPPQVGPTSTILIGLMMLWLVTYMSFRFRRERV